MTERTKNHLWKGLLVSVMLGGAAFVALQPNQTVKPTKSQRLDPTIDEMIKQARGLQKVGRWEAAADILTQLAHDGHPVALYHLGRAFKNGWGTERDLPQARAAFLEAVRYQFRFRGETAYELGRLFQRSSGEKCAAIALQWFEKALAWDYPKAHVQLAKHYERGIGTDRDLDVAFFHYERAAIAGYPSSTINYARILYTGRYGVVQDLEQAQFWADRAISGLEKKARDGSASAAKTLGRIYRDGEFRPPDRQKSESWFIRSASLGDAGAMHDLAQMLLADEPSEKGGKGVLKWLSLAAKAEHGGALTTLARLHLKNRFGLDPKASVDLLKRGVAVGHPGAMEELGRLYAEGKFVEQDRAKALELASKGADRGHQGSSRLLKALEDVASADSSENASRSLNQDTSGKG